MIGQSDRLNIDSASRVSGISRSHALVRAVIPSLSVYISSSRGYNRTNRSDNRRTRADYDRIFWISGIEDNNTIFSLRKTRDRIPFPARSILRVAYLSIGIKRFAASNSR